MRPIDRVSRSAAENLILSPDGLTLSWDAPTDPGGNNAVFYDVLRSGQPTDFDAGGFCVESDGLDTIALDGDVPAVGSLFHYLVRAENACGVGSLGPGDGPERQGRACP